MENPTTDKRLSIVPGSLLTSVHFGILSLETYATKKKAQQPNWKAGVLTYLLVFYTVAITRCSEQACLEGADLCRMHLMPVGWACVFVITIVIVVIIVVIIAVIIIVTISSIISIMVMIMMITVVLIIVKSRNWPEQSPVAQDVVL